MAAALAWQLFGQLASTAQGERVRHKPEWELAPSFTVHRNDLTELVVLTLPPLLIRNVQSFLVNIILLDNQQASTGCSEHMA